MMKIAMINVHNEIRARKLKSKMILQVHDELVFDVYKPELEELKALVVDKMEKAMLLGDVPVVVDCGTGESWFDAH
jgi:DNA polymerase-1